MSEYRKAWEEVNREEIKASKIERTLCRQVMVVCTAREKAWSSMVPVWETKVASSETEADAKLCRMNAEDCQKRAEIEHRRYREAIGKYIEACDKEVFLSVTVRQRPPTGSMLWERLKKKL